jgi:hypothetical protein
MEMDRRNWPAWYGVPAGPAISARARACAEHDENWRAGHATSSGHNPRARAHLPPVLGYHPRGLATRKFLEQDRAAFEPTLSARASGSVRPSRRKRKAKRQEKQFANGARCGLLCFDLAATTSAGRRQSMLLRKYNKLKQFKRPTAAAHMDCSSD